MAQAGDFLYQDQFNCPICLDLLKDPVAIPCGHSYCMGCIKDCWNQDDPKGVYSCPQCRHTFTPRPVLNKNTILAEVVENLKKTGLQAAPPSHCYAGPGDVACDVCTGRKLKAVKSCLVCLASYCETDLKLHDKLNPGKQHKLVNATGQLKDKICSDHHKMLEVFCRTDQKCICYLCTMDEHRGHDTVSASAERAEKQKQFGETQKKNQQRIQEREKELEELRIAVESLTRSAQAAVEDSEMIFTELICSIKRRRSEVKQLIRAQEKTAVKQAEGPMKRLEQEIADLRRRDAKLGQLSQTEDHIHFLQSFESLCAPPGSGDLPSISLDPFCSFGDVTKAVSDLKKQLEEVCMGELIKVSETVNNVDILHVPEPKTREEFLQYACQLTLDPNKVNQYVRLPGGDRVLTALMQYPDHPERFDYRHRQVLCREGLSDRSYWEAEFCGVDGVDIAVAYKGIGRRGKMGNCGLGRSDKSWSLRCTPCSYSFWHNNNETAIRAPHCSRIGVYLDQGAGTLSFYSVSKKSQNDPAPQSPGHVHSAPLSCLFGLWDVHPGVVLGIQSETVPFVITKKERCRRFIIHKAD